MPDGDSLHWNAQARWLLTQLTETLPHSSSSFRASGFRERLRGLRVVSLCGQGKGGCPFAAPPSWPPWGPASPAPHPPPAPPPPAPEVRTTCGGGYGWGGQGPPCPNPTWEPNWALNLSTTTASASARRFYNASAAAGWVSSDTIPLPTPAVAHSFSALKTFMFNFAQDILPTTTRVHSHGIAGQCSAGAGDV